MQKKLIALAIAGLASTAAFAQTNVTVYGVADGTFDVISSKDGVSTQNTGGSDLSKGDYNRVSANSSYIGFKGTEDLGNGLKAVFQYEVGVAFDNGNAGSATNSSPFAARDQFVGLSDAKMGTVVLGNLTGPTRALGATLDVNPGATGIGANSGLIGKLGGNPLSSASAYTGCANSSTCTSVFDTRWGNAIAYVSPSIAGFTGVAAYVADENKSREDQNNTTGSARTTGYDLGIKWEGSGFMAGVTYNWAQLGDLNATQVDNLRLGATYTAANWSVRAMWEQTGYDARTANDKQDKWGLGGTFTLGKTQLIAQYYQALESDNGRDNGAQLWEVGALYNLSKRTQLKAVYAAVDNDRNGQFDFGVNSVGTGAVGSTVATYGAYNQGIQMGVRHNF